MKMSFPICFLLVLRDIRGSVKWTFYAHWSYYFRFLQERHVFPIKSVAFAQGSPSFWNAPGRFSSWEVLINPLVQPVMIGQKLCTSVKYFTAFTAVFSGGCWWFKWLCSYCGSAFGCGERICPCREKHSFSSKWRFLGWCQATAQPEDTPDVLNCWFQVLQEHLFLHVKVSCATLEAQGGDAMLDQLEIRRHKNSTNHISSANVAKVSSRCNQTCLITEFCMNLACLLCEMMHLAFTHWSNGSCRSGVSISSGSDWL